MFERSSPARATRTRRARSSSSAPRCCRRCRCTAATATGPRRLPSPATSSSSARSAPAPSLAFPNTVLNTIVAEAIDDLAGKLEAKLGGRRWTAPRRSPRSSRTPTTRTSRSCFGGDNYDEAWHAEAEKRGLKNLRTHARRPPGVLADATVDAFGNYNVLSRARARVALRGLGRAVHHQRQHRGRDRRGDREDDDPAGGAALPAAGRRRRGAGGDQRGQATRRRAHRRRSASLPRPTPTPTVSRVWSWPSTPATTSSPAWRRSARPRTSWRRWSPTTSGRCRSTRRSSSSSSGAQPELGGHRASVGAQPTSILNTRARVRPSRSAAHTVAR